ncbi:MAG: hypothetical protein IJM25_10315 [Eubacterium sp.]|nr:hypothetical protein [Eubacterium sp.]
MKNGKLLQAVAAAAVGACLAGMPIRAEAAESRVAGDMTECGTVQEASEGDVEIDAAHFPDAAFRNYVLKNIDQDHNTILSVSEAEAVTTINVGRYNGAKDVYEGSIGAKNLTGLRYFPNLQCLECADNRITTLDVSGNPELVTLQCDMNWLSKLDVSRNPKLKVLYAGWNRLTALDVSGNPELEELGCQLCYLRELDVSGNSKLTYLNCGENELSTLKITGLPDLEVLYCESNRLKEINIKACPKLTTLTAQGNQILVLDARVQGDQLKELKVDKDRTAVIRSEKNLGWYHIGDEDYYVESCGDGRLDVRLATGWRQIKGNYYYFLGNGTMWTGWRRVGGKYYYMNEQGVMQTGWKKIGKKWFCFSSGGVMQTGWKKSGGKWYYLNSDGTMAVSTSKYLGGKTYKFDKNGVCTNP